MSARRGVWSERGEMCGKCGRWKALLRVPQIMQIFEIYFGNRIGAMKLSVMVLTGVRKLLSRFAVAALVHPGELLELA